MKARILLAFVLAFSSMTQPIHAQSFTLANPINTTKLTNVSSPITRISTPTITRISQPAPSAPTPVTTVAPVSRTPVMTISPVTSIPSLPALSPIAPVRTTPVTGVTIAPVNTNVPATTATPVANLPTTGVTGLIDRPAMPGFVHGVVRGVGTQGIGNMVSGNGNAPVCPPGLSIGDCLPGNGNNGNGPANGYGSGNGLGGLLSNCNASRIHGVGAGLLGQGCSNNPFANLGPAGQFALATAGAGGVLVSVSNQAQAHLVLFSSANQVMQGANGQAIAGEPGTLIDKSKGCVFLHTGRITVSSGKAPAEVQSKLGSITLNPDVLAVVDQQVDRPLRVMALRGQGEMITIKSHACGERTITLKAGEELVLADSKLEEEDLIPADGLTRVLVSGGIEKQTNVAKSRFNVSQVMPTGKRSRAGRTVALGAAHLSAIRGTGAAAAEAPQTWQASEAIVTGKSKDSAPAHIVAQPGTQLIQSEDGNLNLALGMVLLQARSDINVTTPIAHMELKKKAVAMIESRGETVRIKALTGPGDVRVKAGNHTVDVTPGEEIVVSDRVLTAAELNPQDAIARRIKSSQRLSDKLVISINDFSLVSMLRYPANRQAVLTTDTDGTLLRRLMKTAAVVEIVTRGRGQYAYHQPEQTLSVAQTTKVE